MFAISEQFTCRYTMKLKINSWQLKLNCVACYWLQQNDSLLFSGYNITCTMMFMYMYIRWIMRKSLWILTKDSLTHYTVLTIITFLCYWQLDTYLLKISHHNYKWYNVVVHSHHNYIVHDYMYCMMYMYMMDLLKIVKYSAFNVIQPMSKAWLPVLQCI